MPRKRTLEPSEHASQVAFVEWVRAVEHTVQYRSLLLSFAVPNGARVGIGQARKLVAEGLRRGVCDWWLPFATPGYDGLALEFKTRLGRLSIDQIVYRKRLQLVNWRVEVCRSTDAAIEIVKDYLCLTTS